MNKEQFKGKLVQAGIGAKYVHHKVSELTPEAVPLVTEWKDWLDRDSHVLFATDKTLNMLVFTGAVMASSNFNTYVMDTAILVSALERWDSDEMDKVRDVDILGLTNFYEHKKHCPFSPWQIRLLEGYISKLSREQSTSFILDIDHTNLDWYSSRFVNLIKGNCVEFVQQLHGKK